MSLQIAAHILDTFRAQALAVKNAQNFQLAWVRDNVGHVIIEVRVTDFDVVYLFTNGCESYCTESYTDARRALMQAFS